MKKFAWIMALALVGTAPQAHAGTWGVALQPDNVWLRSWYGEDYDTYARDMDSYTGTDYLNFYNGGFEWSDASSCGFPITDNGDGFGNASFPYGVHVSGVLRAVYSPSTGESTTTPPKSLVMRLDSLIQDQTQGADPDRLHIVRGCAQME